MGKPVKTNIAQTGIEILAGDLADGIYIASSSSTKNLTDRMIIKNASICGVLDLTNQDRVYGKDNRYYFVQQVSIKSIDLELK